MGETVITPNEGGDWVRLSRNRAAQGTVFKKHILSRGKLLHPTTGKAIEIDDTFMATLQKNFEDGVSPIVQVPLAGPNNEHTEEPEKNAGEVIQLDYDSDAGKLYALIDARKHEEDFGKTLLGASAMMTLDGVNTSTGDHVGPNLVHVAVTNNPYINNLDDFEAVVAASNETSEVIILEKLEDKEQEEKEISADIKTEGLADGSVGSEPDEEIKMTLEEILAELNETHGIDVAALQAEAGRVPELETSAALSKTVTDALVNANVIQLSNTNQAEEVTAKEVLDGIAELAQKTVALSNSVATLEADKKALIEAEAEREVDALVDSGHILPKQRDVMLSLRLENKESFKAMLPEEPIVKLSKENGTQEVPPSGAKFDAADLEKIAEEAARYVSMSNTRNKTAGK